MTGKKNGFVKKLVALGLSAVMTLGVFVVPGTSNITKVQAAAKIEPAAEDNYDYGRAWQQTLMFYEFQKSGRISEDDPECNRNNWKGDCEWNDGEEVGLDLTGGWHDAGDHVKFNLPMSYSATMLAWSYLEYQDTYDAAGQSKYLLNEIKWVSDYLIKCHAKENLFYYQVGDGDIDHQFWGAPELIDVPGVREIQMPKISRPCYYVTNKPEEGGSAVCAGSAATLAATAIAYKDIDPEYSELCVKHAKELYQMALEAQSDVGYMEHAMGYYSSTHFEDELSWGGAWLYKATGEKDFLATAESYDHKWGGTQMTGNLKGNVWTQCWDDVRYGAMLLIAELDDGEKGQEHKEGIEYNLDYWSTGVIEGNGNPARGKFSKKGLVMINDWGSVRYAGAQAAMAMFYCNWDGADPERVDTYREFAKSQADYILGSSGRSYIVGYDETSPRNPHHRTADGAWKNSPLKCPDVSRHTLVGAVVGGPDGSEFYDDNRNNYCTNEVANDYNAGPLCLMAAMYAEYGGTIDPNINAVEEVGEEYYMDGCNYQQGVDNEGASFCEVKLTIENHTAWPARPSEKLKFRYFVNIKDALEQGAKPEDFSIISYYAQRISTVTDLIPWNEEEGIYYVEVAFGQEEEQLKAYDEAGIHYEKLGNATPFMYPGGDVECRADMQLRIASPAGVEWDYTKNPSYVEIKDTKVDEKKKIQNIPVYEGDTLVGGIEPNKTGKVDLTIPDVAVDEISLGTSDNDGNVTPVVNYSIESGETCEPNVIIKPESATDKTLTWKSMNTNVATVDENGVITGVAKGSTSIIVWANGGGKVANCVVDVDGGVEDLFAAKVMGQEVDWVRPEVQEGEPVSNSDTQRPDPSEQQESVEKVEVEKLTFSPNELSIPKDTTQTVKPVITPLDATEKVLTWESDNPEVATVKAGRIYAKEEGTAVITATAKNGVKDSITVTVTPAATEVEKVTLSPLSGMQVQIGETEPIKSTVLPKTAIDKTLTWESSDPEIVEVNERGDVIAKALGKVTVTATANNGVKDSIEVTVVEKLIEAKTITLSPADLELKVGEKKILQMILSPQDANDKNVIWTSTKPEVATVSSTGEVTAKAKGTAVITATASNGVEGKARLTVSDNGENPEVESVTIVLKDSSVSVGSVVLEAGEKKALKAEILPESAANQTLIWESDNTKVADVSDDGMITAKAAGKATITATAPNGETGSIAVSVIQKKEDVSNEEVTNVNILPPDSTDSQSGLQLSAGDKKTLKVEISPVSASDQKLTWRSSNSKVASVSENGEITAHAEGTAVITATAPNGERGSITVTVTGEPEETTDKQPTTEQKVTTGKQPTTEQKVTTGKQPTTGQKVTTGKQPTTEQKVTTGKQPTTGQKVTTGKQPTTEQEEDPTNQPDTDEKEDTDKQPTTEQKEDTDEQPTTEQKEDSGKQSTVQPSGSGDQNTSTESNNANASSNANTDTSTYGPVNLNTNAAFLFESEADGLVKPAKVTGLKKKLLRKNRVKLSWKKLNGVTGYAVYQYDWKNHKWKLCKKLKAKSITIKNLKTNTSYKFKVRAYKKNADGIKYGAYSKIVKVKVKK